MFGIKCHTAPASQKRGFLLSQDIDSDRKVEHDLVQCCHCQRLWVWRPGSGRVRGWCSRCNGITCGPQCPTKDGICVSARQLLDNLEMGLPFDLAANHRPIVVAVGAEPPRG